MSVPDRVLAPFERWSSTAFIVGGVGILGTTVTGSLQVASVVESPPWLQGGPLLFGLWFVFVGLVGFYQYPSESASRLSLGGVVTAGIAWVIWTATLLAAIGVDLTSQRSFVNPGSWGPPLLTVGFVLALVSFLLYGLASVRSEQPSRTLGLLLLVPVVAFFGQAVLLISKILSGEVLSFLQLALGGVIGIALIAVGYRLVTGADSTTSTEARTDAAT